jgi:hypothetical protein
MEAVDYLAGLPWLCIWATSPGPWRSSRSGIRPSHPGSQGQLRLLRLQILPHRNSLAAVVRTRCQGFLPTAQLPEKLSLKTESRFIINCGSVGQPRDGDPRASYAVIDTEQESLWHCRVKYDFKVTQEKILDADLPVRLASRLSVGW